MSAYSCEPGRGSEPGVGWNVANGLAEQHDVWVLTRTASRGPVEGASEGLREAGVRFIFYDLPRWLRFWNRGERGIRTHYCLWQIAVYFVARRLHREIRLDLCHHVTFAKYWAPSFVSFLPVPFIWGPVGGGETAPWPFVMELGWRGKLYEVARMAARWLGERDPFVRLTARRSALSLAATGETADRLLRMSAANVKVVSQVCLSQPDIDALAWSGQSGRVIRLMSVGNLLHFKGVHLGLRGFARAGVPNCEYWVVGDGPERKRLEALAARLGVSDRVKFTGKLPRNAVFDLLRSCYVLVYPSLHDSGGFAVAEAMAAGVPVICLGLGGPAIQVTSETGIVIPAHQPDQVVNGLAAAIKELVRDPDTRNRMSRAARSRVAESFNAKRLGKILNQFYAEILNTQLPS